MSEKIQLGEILTGTQHRDATHIALAPIIAGEPLAPGSHIGIRADGRAANKGVTLIGVVDPFLKHPVRVGQQFYMFLYPNTVTGMRHQWEHPSFDNWANEEVGIAEKWIRNWAESECIGYEEVMAAAARFQKHGDYWCEGGRFEGSYLPEEFWDHYEIVTGTKVKDRYSFFSCSC